MDCYEEIGDQIPPRFAPTEPELSVEPQLLPAEEAFVIP
jgi:hypothetical protein